jgi:hypothetical protein
VSPHGAFAQPLSERLGGGVHVIYLDKAGSSREVLEAARSAPSGSLVIWVWRQTRDIPPENFVTKLEQELSLSYVQRREFVAHSLLERLAHRLLRGPGQAEYYYLLSEFRKDNSEANEPGIPK